MSNTLNDDLPEVLKTVRSRPLFVMRLDVRKLQVVGATPGAFRRIGVVPGGSFEGERLSGGSTAAATLFAGCAGDARRTECLACPEDFEGTMR
jgi:hypothetical protein